MDTLKKFIWAVFFILVIPLVLYNLYTGLTVGKIGLPGGFTIEFRDPNPNLNSKSTPSLGSISPSPTPSKSPQPDPPQTFAPQPSLPENTCPVVQGMFWMQLPNTWYGPFVGGDGISFSSAGGFYVWDADMLNVLGTYGAVIPYPDPLLQIPRKVWIPLQQSRFSVCVDGLGNVFGLQR
jgi:hypothetical protein